MHLNKSIETKRFDRFDFEIYSDKVNFKTLSVNQVHGNTVAECSNTLLDADAIVCTCGECTLAIKTADCLPIAIIGDLGHAIVHAGWRGLEKKILFNKNLEKINPKHFIIGPHINQASYEVSKDFLNYFDGKYIEKISDKFFFSLLDCSIAHIKENYPSASIDIFSSCTFLDNRYNSYRRNKTKLRNWNILKRIDNE